MSGDRGDLWNGKLSCRRNSELVLVCRGRLCLCMAGGNGGVFQEKKYSEE